MLLHQLTGIACLE